MQTYTIYKPDREGVYGEEITVVEADSISSRNTPVRRLAQPVWEYHKPKPKPVPQPDRLVTMVSKFLGREVSLREALDTLRRLARAHGMSPSLIVKAWDLSPSTLKTVKRLHDLPIQISCLAAQSRNLPEKLAELSAMIQSSGDELARIVQEQLDQKALDI